MHFKQYLMFLAALPALAFASPLPETSTASVEVVEDGYVCGNATSTGTGCEIVRAPATGLAKRDIVAKIYYSNDGHVKMILPWIVNANIAQLFSNSGYNLAKSLLGEVHRWIAANGGAEAGVIAAFADWYGQMDQKSRYLGDIINISANYATLAVGAKTGGAPEAYILANAIARWYSQSGSGSNVISLGSTSAEFFGNAAGAKKRGVVEEKDEQESSPLEARADFCTSGVGGMYWAGSVQHTPRGLWYDINC